MPAGYVTKTVGDGNLGTFTARFLSSDGTTGGLLYPAPVPTDSSGVEILPATAAQAGSLTETAPATDTASSGLNGRLQRLAQRLTTLMAQIPTTLGTKTAANSLSITTSSDDLTVAALGAQADTAWTTGAGSIVALLKALAGQALSTTPASTLPVLTAAANGLTASRIVATASTNANFLKASAGNIGEIDLFNAAAYSVFLKLYNKASAPTLALATPVNSAFSTATTGGTLANSASYFYRVSAINANGETLASTETSQAVAAPLATPVNAAFSTATTGGTLAAGTYYYRVSALNAVGETLASTETSQVTSGTTSTVTVNWGAVSGATGYKIYGRATGAELLIATVGVVTTYIDTGTPAPSGALPVSNTTATATNTVTVNWGAVAGVTGYKVYGRTTGAELLIATLGVVTTYVDTGSVTPSGALPAANTTADTPVWTIPIQASGGYSKSFPRGRSFATGIAYAITKLQADSDTTVLVAGDVTGSIAWI